MTLPIPTRPDAIVVRCARRTHRVRLGRGRFWRRARCPSCGAAVDPWRWRRVGRAALRLVQPAAGTGRQALVWAAATGYLAATLAIAVTLWWLGDRWWLATAVLFGPRWLLLIPVAALAVGAWLVDRSLLPSIALAGLVVVGPTMGLRLGLRGWLAGGDPSTSLRVVTLNAQGDVVAGGIRSLLLEWEADVVAFQECGEELAARVRAGVGWHVDAHESLCLASRYPIAAVEQLDREAFKAARGSALVVTYRLDLGPGRGAVHLTNVHFETPREGLAPLRSGDLDEGITRLAEKTMLRGIEHRQARDWIDRYPGPGLVVGDFNAPVESVIYRAAWGDWRNAFSTAGWGFGATRMNGWIRARIDHILVDHRWTVRRAWVGDDVGSDHRPMFAELRLRAAPE